MDELDQKLISELRHDARVSLSDLAAILKVTRATVRTRIERLRQRGDIIGFSVVLKGDHQLDQIRGLMMIGIEGRGSDRIVRQLQGMPNVRTIHTTNGRWDLIVELGTETLEEFDQVLNAIRRLDGITTSETNLLLASRKKT